MLRTKVKNVTYKGKNKHYWMLNVRLLFRTAAVVFSQLSAGIFWAHTNSITK